MNNELDINEEKTLLRVAKQMKNRIDWLKKKDNSKATDKVLSQKIVYYLCMTNTNL